MNMPCRITDESINNPWEIEAVEEHATRCPLSLTIDELMGDNFYPYIFKNKTSGFNLSIDDEKDEGQELQNIHPAAMESMADFCRRFLQSYDNATRDEK